MILSFMKIVILCSAEYKSSRKQQPPAFDVNRVPFQRQIFTEILLASRLRIHIFCHSERVHCLSLLASKKFMNFRPCPRIQRAVTFLVLVWSRSDRKQHFSVVGDRVIKTNAPCPYLSFFKAAKSKPARKQHLPAFVSSPFLIVSIV